MKIVADENIPYLHECFGQVAEVVALNGRYLAQADLRDADALIVRSVTPVTRELLEGTPVRFVGSCTIGIDHVDTDYLDEKGIAFSSAPGSNADSAAQYTLCALLVMANRLKLSLADLTIGIIGCGNVGSRVKHMVEALGCRTLVNDPPLAERGRSDLVSLEETLAADVVTFHVPLTRKGKYPTQRMINAELLAQMSPDTVLINGARGDLVAQDSLRDDIAHRGRKVVLDVWPNEPRIDEALLSMVQIATPHIAGYSFDGKLRGTEMVYEAFCRALGLDYQPVKIELDEPPIISISEDASLQEAVSQAALTSYNILADDAALRELLNEPPIEQGAFFDNLRKHYPVRREFSAYRCYGSHPSIDDVLEQLGFRVIR